MADRVGQHLGNYRLVSLLGQGGYAEVYLGQHLRLDLQAAIKVLHTHLSSKEVEHFQQEAETIARLRHSAIVRVFDFDVQEGVPFLVMDYAPNGSLRRRHPQGEVVPLAQIVSYVRQVADALQYAHNLKLIHRDVKPENMLLGWHEEVLLSDFGIATVAHSTGSLSAETAVGTIASMAPEQIQGHPRPASDQYGLGVTIYEWLCGARPFEGSFTELVTHHLWQSPPPLQDRAPAISPAVEQVVLRALAKDPKQRFITIAAFAEALEQASQAAMLPAASDSPGLLTEAVPPASRSAVPTELALLSDASQSSTKYATPEGQATAPTPPPQQFPDIPYRAPSGDIIDLFVPSHVRDRIADRIVTILMNASPDERWHNLIHSFHSDPAFHDAIDQALKRAVQRFAQECPDSVAKDALVHNTRFWELSGVQKALKEIVIRPSSYLWIERNIAYHAFADVLPTLPPERVEQAVRFFFYCLAEEVVNIPQLAPIYQVQLQKASLDQARQMVMTLRVLQKDQRLWLRALLQSRSLNPILFAVSDQSLPAPASGSLLPAATTYQLPDPIALPGMASSITASALNNQTSKILHNLPPQYGVFLGREKDIERVLEGLSSRWPLISIEGLAGIGKTRLAIEAAHRCIPGPDTTIDQPFEVAVWVSAGDRPEQIRWINEVLDTVARVLGYPYVMQVAPENKTIEVDHLLRNHRMLVIVDNFETIDDPDLLNWIQRVPEPSKALITTRHHHLRRVWDIHLKGLGDTEALELIRRNAQRLGLQSVQTASEELLLPLARVTGGTPRILEMALGYVKGGRLSLQEVVDDLHEATKTVESIFDYLFAHAWNLMTRDTQQVLLSIPFFMDLVSKEALGATANLSGYLLDAAVEQLVELALLDINEELAVSNQRYSTHPLTRAFASSKLSEEQAFEVEARMRWSKYYVEYTTRNIVREKPVDTYWNVLTSRGYMELDLEWPNLQNVLIWMGKQQEDEMLLQLMLLLAHYMGRRLLYPERITYARLAAEAAARLNRKKDEAWLRIDALGYILIEEGRFSEAKQEISTGLQITQNMPAESLDTIDLIALGHAFLARAFLEQGDIAEAAAIIERVLNLECTPLIRCRVNMVAGDIAIRNRNYTGAISLYEAATRITQEEEDADFDAILRYRLGTAYLANMELTRAEEEFKKVPEPQGINIWAMYIEYGLARVAWARGDKEQARRLAQNILEILSRFTSSHPLLGLVNTFLDSVD
jgi:serine/threonine protein kinase/tetratricopeptide (TPR) repeat protein